MSEKQVVIAIFDNENAADAAADQVKAWARESSTVDTSAIGVLALDEKGKVKTDKMGSRSTLKGAGIGVVLAALTPATLGGAAVAGGLIGALHHKGLGLDQSDQDRIASELTGGKAAVGVMTKRDQAHEVTHWLSELGGKPETHDVSEESLEHAADATAAVVGTSSGS